MVQTNYNLFTTLLISLTAILFGYGLYIDDINSVILHTLEFLILFEIVRAMAEFILNKQNRVKMRYIIDSAILFSIRELYVGLVEIHNDTMITFSIFGYEFTMLLGIIMTFVSLTAIGALVFIRTKLVKYSPDFFNE